MKCFTTIGALHHFQVGAIYKVLVLRVYIHRIEIPGALAYLIVLRHQ